MEKDKGGADKFANLRQQAEELLRQEPEEIANLPPGEIQTLVHQLQVYQIELELQNEELRRSQQQLEESRNNYADLYDFAPIGYFTLNDKGLILAANLTGAHLLGADRSWLMKHRFSRFIASVSQDQFYIHCKQLFTTQIQQTCHLKMVKKDGTPFDVRLESMAVQANRGTDKQFRTAVIDITEQVRAEESLRENNLRLESILSKLTAMQQQIVQQENLASIGRLAAGIAHEFNNILTSIIGFAELLKLSSDIPEPHQEDLSRILEGGRRAAYLVRQILDFSRKSVPTFHQINLIHLIEDVVELVKHTLPENIHTSVEIEPGEYVTKADRRQLQQLFINLILNARDAMPAGGTLRLSLSHLALKPEDRPPHVKMGPGDWGVISVTDTGTGIPLELLPHIFEPFFTTKEVGKGAGLGLAQVYGIVEQHQGYITTESNSKQGTIFTIYLPVTSADTDYLSTAELDKIPHGHGETILLVEDDLSVLAVDKAMLNHLNYRVLTAINGQEALDIYAAHKDEIALVLSDAIMPEMGDLILFQSLQAQNSVAKMIMMTGYPFRERASTSLEQGVIGRIQKPISLQQMAQVIYQALQERPAKPD